MSDHAAYIDDDVSSGNRVFAEWLNAVNDFTYRGRDYNFGTSTGAANAYVLTLAGGVRKTTLEAGDRFTFLPNFTNSGPCTLEVIGATSLGVKNIFDGGVACVNSEIAQGVPVEVAYDGTQFNIMSNYVRSSTWAPAITFATPGDLNVVYSTQTGSAVRIGRLVLLQAQLITSTFTFTTAAGNLLITGVSGAGGSNDVTRGVCSLSGWTKANYTQLTTALGAGATSLLIKAAGSGQPIVNLAAGDFASGTNVNLSLTHMYLR